MVAAARAPASAGSVMLAAVRWRDAAGPGLERTGLKLRCWQETWAACRGDGIQGLSRWSRCKEPRPDGFSETRQVCLRQAGNGWLVSIGICLWGIRIGRASALDCDPARAQEGSGPANALEPAGRGLWEAWNTEGRRLAAPSLLYYEVANALFRYQQLGYLSAGALQLAFQAALALPLQLQGEADLHWRALELAGRLSLPAAYDAHYLALAERLGGEFWTADRRLTLAVQAALPWVHLVQ